MVCTKCGEDQPLTEFSPRQSHCKSCKRYYARLQYSVSPDQKADQSLRLLYKRSLEWYDKTLAEQGGCGVCGRQPNPGERRFHVDHDHRCCPGKKTCGNCVRGIVCSGCNTGAGIIDNPELLRKRADYLERFF